MTDSLPTRRVLLAGIAASALSGCDEPRREARMRSNAGNLYEELAGMRFRRADGSIVTMEDLRPQLSTKNSVVSFGWSNCEDYCPTTNVALGQLHRDYPGTHRNVVINVTPEQDGPLINPTLGRDGHLHHMILEEAGVPSPLILYPVDANGAFSNQVAIQAQQRLDDIVNQNDSTKHTGYIHVFDRSGLELARVDATRHPGDISEQLSSAMQSGMSR